MEQICTSVNEAVFPMSKTTNPMRVGLAGFVLETLLNRCIRVADRETVCVI